MRTRRVVLLLSLALLLLAPPCAAAVAARTMWTDALGATLYAAPSPFASIQARLPANQPLRVFEIRGGWGRTLLWNAVPAWAPLTDLRDLPGPAIHRVGIPSRRPPVGPHAAMPLAARMRLRVPAFLRSGPSFDASRTRLLPASATLTLTSWATDTGGAAWYRAAAPTNGWVFADATTLLTPQPARPAMLLAPFRGTGMWFTYALLKNSPVASIVAAARAARLTHLYVEVGRSQQGFYGASGLDALLPAAHRAGLRVIAWVYPFLADLPSDVAMTVAAARYTTVSGDHPDGVLADVEENTMEGSVRAYGQVVRATLGADEPMAVGTFPPQGSRGRAYPFATEALTWNVIVPMDYWHTRLRAYTAAETYAFVRDSVRLIRGRTRPDQAVEVLGQMYDPFQSGVNNPGAAEIVSCAAAAHDTGAIGVSFFEWNHATPEEWSVLPGLKERWL